MGVDLKFIRNRPLLVASLLGFGVLLLSTNAAYNIGQYAVYFLGISAVTFVVTRVARDQYSWYIKVAAGLMIFGLSVNVVISDYAVKNDVKAVSAAIEQNVKDVTDIVLEKNVVRHQQVVSADFSNYTEATTENDFVSQLMRLSLQVNTLQNNAKADFDQKLAHLDFEKMLSPEGLSTISGAVKLKAAALEYSENYESLEKLQNSYMKAYEQTATKIGVNFPNQLQKFNDGLNKSKVRLQKIASIEREIVKIFFSVGNLVEYGYINRTLTFDQSAQKLIFANTPDLNRFNAYAQKLGQLSSEEESLLKQYIAESEGLLNKMKKVTR